MKCLEPNCTLSSTARKTPGYCAKHKTAHQVIPVRVILRIIDNEFLLCFPDREVLEGRMRVWGAAGPKTVRESDYMYGAFPKNVWEHTTFRELIARYQQEFSVTLHVTRAWTTWQKKMCWGLTNK